MALTLPKLAVPKLALGKKQLPAVVLGVVVVAAAGWFGWQYFEDAGPAPAKPQTATPAKATAAGKAAAPADAGPTRDKLVEDLLVASGLKQTLSQLPQKLMAGFRQSGKPKASAAVLKAMETAVAESFSAQGFHGRVSAALKKDFDQKRVQTLLKDYAAPGAKRMVEQEQASSRPEELAQFARSAAATRPSPARAALIKRIDAAIRASDLAVEVAFSSMKGLALSATGGGAEKAAAVDKAMEKQRAASTVNIRNATLLNLAYSYRNASDADLQEYAKFYETENSKWLSGIVYTSLVEEVKSASAQAGARVVALAAKPVAQERTTPQERGTPKAPTAAQERAPARSRSQDDARGCLNLASNKAIMACAEKYR